MSNKKSFLVFNFILFNISLCFCFFISYNSYAEYCSEIVHGVVEVGDFDDCRNKINGEECIEKNISYYKDGKKIRNNNRGVLYTINTESGLDTCSSSITDEESNVVTLYGDTVVAKVDLIIDCQQSDDGKYVKTTKKPKVFTGTTLEFYSISNGIEKKENQAKPAEFKGWKNNCSYKNCNDLSVEEAKAIEYSKNFIDNNGAFLYEKVASTIYKNPNNKYANEQIDMIQAIALSDNIYALKTLLLLGSKNLVKLL